MKIRKQITVCKKDAELIIYPESRNELGLWVAHPPCLVSSSNDAHRIESMIDMALQYSNSGVPLTEETTKSVLEETRIKSWNALYRSYKIISYSITEEEIIITPFVYTRRVYFLIQWRNKLLTQMMPIMQSNYFFSCNNNSLTKAGKPSAR